MTLITQSAPRRALLVIDVQNEYVTGNLPIEYPDVRSSLRNIARAMDAARAHEIPVLVVQNSAPSDARLFAKGSPGWELHEVVRMRPRDHYVEKNLPSAFAGTELASWLERARIDTLSVVGYMTHNCVDSTVKQAFHAGLTAECLYDATGSVPYANSAGRASARRIHEAVSVVMHSRFAAVLNTDDWLPLLERGQAAPRDTIFASNQRARSRASTDMDMG
jgi:nicotinamidase-related amidase